MIKALMARLRPDRVEELEPVYRFIAPE